MRRKNNRLLIVASLSLISVLLASVFGCTPEQEISPTSTISMPELIKISGYDVGSNSYVALNSLGEASATKFGMKMRQYPASNAMARISAIRTGMADISLVTADVIFASEGVLDFAEESWGPQPLRVLWQGIQVAPFHLATRGDTGIKTFADLKGKKLPNFVGSVSTNLITEACLAWGELTWADVETVDVYSFGSMYEALGDGTIDACPIGATAPVAQQLEADPSKGLYYMPTPPDDVEGWNRLEAVHPALVPYLASVGAGVSEENPVWVTMTPWIIFTYADLPANEAYWVTKVCSECYDEYSAMAATLEGWTLEETLELPLVFAPWHDGSVDYFEEIGVWTDQHGRNQQALLERREAILGLWEDVREDAAEEGIPSSKFTEYWLEKRAARFPKWFEPVS
jgi:hypothetical protein